MNNIPNRIVKIIYNALSLVMLLCLLYFFIKCFYVAIRSFYPREYRDGANVNISFLFAKGINPYTIFPYDVAQPFCAYTSFNSLIVAFFGNFFHSSIYVTQYVLDVVYMFIISAASGIYVYIKTDRKLHISLLSASIYVICSYKLGYISSDPSRLGVLLLLGLFIYIDINEISLRSVTVIAIWLIVLFYVKQYFAILVIPILIYIFLIKKKYALYLLIETSLFGLISIIIVDMILPSFTIETLYFFLCGYERTGEKAYYFKYSLEQFFLFLKLFFPEVCFIIVSFMKMKSSRKNIWTMSSICMVPVVFLLAETDGAFMSYYFQLLLPFVIMSFSLFCAKIEDSQNIFIVYFLTILWNVYFAVFAHSLYTVQDTNYLEREEWRAIYSEIDNCLYDDVLLYSPILNYYSFDRGIDIPNNGHTDYLEYLLMEKSSNVFVKILDYLGLMDRYDELTVIEKDRVEYMKNKILNHEYSMIVVDQICISTFSDEMNDGGYEEYECYLLRTGKQCWKTWIYK